MLISQGAIAQAESETDAAERFRAHYGIERGYLLALVLRTCSRGPMAAYWRTVAHELGQMIAPRENLFAKLATTATIASRNRTDLKRGAPIQRDPVIDRRLKP